MQSRLIGLSIPERKTNRHTKQKGDEATAFVLARLLKRYDTVLLPFGENQRYDLVVEEAGRFLKVQCKMGRLRSGTVQFNCYSSSYHHPANQGTRQYHHPYRGQVDYFGVYCPQTDCAYLVPADLVAPSQGNLRVTPTKNNQSKLVRWARDFEI